MANQYFEFRVFPADEWGAMESEAEFSTVELLRDVNAARSRAASYAKRHNGPVDLAYAFDASSVGGSVQEWNDRYITTAAPSDVHTKGVRFERLSG